MGWNVVEKGMSANQLIFTYIVPLDRRMDLREEISLT